MTEAEPPAEGAECKLSARLDDLSLAESKETIIDLEGEGGGARGLKPTADVEEKSDVPEWKVENDYSHYRLLDHSKKEIRLVTIAPGSFDELPHCTLTRHSYPWADVEFESLSYCWGDLKDTTCITLRHDYDGATDSISQPAERYEQTFNVTKSLDLALRHLRFEDKPRTIWIDALCINQGSIRERNYAIPFMVDIYKLAGRVIVFLGEERKTEHFQGMWDLLNMLKEAVNRAGSKPLWQYPDISEAIDEIKITPKNESADPDDSMFRLHMNLIFGEFFNAFPWFKRVWVVQEVMNVKSAVVYCGKQKTAWLDLLVMLCWAAKMSRSYVGGWTASHPHDELPPFLWTQLQAARHGYIDNPPRLPLLDVVSKGRAFKATDPRDKVFALLSFGEETHDISGLPPRLKPDYGKTASEVWRDLTRQWIIDHQSLDILGIMREKIDRNNQVAERTVFLTENKDEKSESDKPSSSGAVEHAPSGHPSWGLWHAEQPGSAQKALFRLENALSHCSMTLDIAMLDNPKDPNILTLPGTTLNPVTSVQWAFKRWTYSEDDMHQFDYSQTPPTMLSSGVAVAWGVLIGAIDELKDNAAKQIIFSMRKGLTINAYPNGTSLIQAFIEALTCRRFSKTWFIPRAPMSLEPEASDQLSASERADLQTMADFAAHWATGLDAEMKWLPPVWAELLKPLAKHGSSRRFTEACEYAEERCFFQTRRAGFGLCPQGTRVGDYVASLAGGSTPFIVRPLEVREGCAARSRFRLVGECYVHDLDIRRVTQAAVARGDVDTLHIV